MAYVKPDGSCMSFNWHYSVTRQRLATGDTSAVNGRGPTDWALPFVPTKIGSCVRVNGVHRSATVCCSRGRIFISLVCCRLCLISTATFYECMHSLEELVTTPANPVRKLASSSCDHYTWSPSAVVLHVLTVVHVI